MGSAMKHVPPGKGQPAPEPPNAWDSAVVSGPDAVEIASLLDELTEIAEVEWSFRHLVKRRNEIFIRLRLLGVTLGRMTRAYAIDGKPIITHVSILPMLRRAGVPAGIGPKRPPKEDS